MAVLLSFQTVIILTRIPIFIDTHFRINELKTPNRLCQTRRESR